ncbi:MAG: HD domain-containing protein [Roseivirga sp.]
MNYLSTDHLIVYAFLLITLAIGLWAGRGIKDIREYAIGNRTFGTAALVLTFLATNVAGESILDLAGEVNKTGIIFPVIFTIGISGGLIVQALIAPNIVSFRESLTMGDIMGTLYGTNSQIITGLLGFFTAICVAGMEIVVLGLFCESLLGIDYRWGVGLGGILLAIYSAHGGIKAVTVTDVFQFLILLIVVPVIAVLALKHAGGIKAVLVQLPAEKSQITSHPNFSYYLILFISFIVFQFPMVDPALVQRILMARTRKQIRNMFLTLAVFSCTLYLAIMLIGMACLVLYPDLKGHDVVPRVVNNLLPVGIKGMSIAGLFAVTMSTVDSFLHAAGLTFVHDVVKPLCDKSDLSINELSWTRYITAFLSLFAIAIGFAHADNLYGLLLISYEFTCPLLSFPLWFGIMGLKPDQRAFYTAAGVTTIVLILAKFLAPESQSHWVPIISVMTNGIVFLGMHAVRNKGFAIVSRKQNKEHIWRPSREQIATQLELLLPTPQRIVKYSQTQVAKYGAPYILLGIFCILNYLVPYFMWEYDNTQTYELMLYLRFIGAMACGLLVVKDKWPEALLPYLPTFWHLTLLYCIPFTSTVMFLLTQGSTEWLINVAITIMFLIVLVDWTTFLILTALGIGLGFCFFTQVVGPINIQLDFSSGYLLVYQGLFATLIGLLFARRKQQRFDQLTTHNQALTLADQENKEKLLEAVRERVRIIQTLKHAGIQDLLQVAKLIRDLQRKAKKLPDLFEATTQLEATLIPMTLQLRGIEDRAANFLRLSVEQLTLQALLKSVKDQLAAQGKDKGVQFYTQTKHQEITCDPKRTQALLVSSITALQTASDNGPILVGIEDTRLHYPIPSVLPDYIKNVTALRLTITTQAALPALQESYRAQLNGAELTAPETAQELILLENRRIVKAHYGHTEVQSDTLYYVIPLDIGEVRPKDLDKPYMELGVMPVRADDHYKGAQAQEKAFLKAVQERSNADLETVKSVIELIKWYHGPVSRRSGEPFYLHPIAVAQIVLDYNTDEATILGALLHDTVEDTAMLLEDIEAVFGKETADIVDTVTHLESQKESFYKVKLSAEENILMLLESDDKRALYVKVADRMHNMRTIGAKPYKSQLRTAKETLQFFVPLCKERLDLLDAAEELKERSAAVIAKNIS